MTPTFQGTIKQGKLLLDDKVSFADWAKTLEGKRIELTLAKYRKKRTSDQNAYYWVILEMMSKESGHSPLELHQALKLKFSNKITWKGLVIPVSTKTKDTSEFTTYIEQVRAWAAEHLNMSIPDPKEVGV